MTTTTRQLAHRLRGFATLFLLSSLFPLTAAAARVVYISSSPHPTVSQQQINEVAHFYGLQVDNISWTNVAAGSPVHLPESDQDTVAVVVDADALPHLRAEDVHALQHKRSRGVPLLITGIRANTSPSALQAWSSGLVLACHGASATTQPRSYQVADIRDVTRQLGGISLPLEQAQIFYLDLSGTATAIVHAKVSGATLPTFARVSSSEGETFFATEQSPVAIPLTADPYRQQQVFASVLAPMIFLHHAAGDRAWHAPGAYANFTIDDLWLREPYGHVSYPALLRQSEVHNFHTTIAFIPWNFDRSQPEVVRLFHDHPERLSICVHGNDHVHQEFGDLQSHLLSGQVTNAEQAIARMERFSQLTHLNYDRVMVFPHSVSPAATFPALRRAHYLATVNSLNVPSDASTPQGLAFALRTGTLQYGAFPSLRRYSAETDIPRSQLAIDAFLGNPTMFYAHESFFAGGAGAFNSIADDVNRLQPATKWTSPGDIVQHLYLEKRRDDRNFDVLALSNSLRLRNDEPNETTFFITKHEDAQVDLSAVWNGKMVPFSRSGDEVALRVTLGPGEEDQLEFRSAGPDKTTPIDISRRSPRTLAIRLLSDFRDNVVSNTELGRWFIRSYAQHGSYWIVGLTILALTFFGLRGRAVASRRKPPQPGRPRLIVS